VARSPSHPAADAPKSEFLERVINCNLTRLGRLLRILRFHAHDLRLKPSGTAYMRWGKGPKQRLQFTKTGDPKVEEAYATHFVWPGKTSFHERAMRQVSARDLKAQATSRFVSRVEPGQRPS